MSSPLPTVSAALLAFLLSAMSPAVLAQSDSRMGEQAVAARNLDACSNWAGNQSVVPAGATQSAGACSCNAGLAYNGGSDDNAACQPAAACARPEGGTLASGASATYWNAPVVAAPGSCSSQVRTCSNGALSGSYAATSCRVTYCSNWGNLTALPAGATQLSDGTCSCPAGQSFNGTQCVAVQQAQGTSCPTGSIPRDSRCNPSTYITVLFNAQCPDRLSIACSPGDNRYIWKHEKGYAPFPICTTSPISPYFISTPAQAGYAGFSNFPGQGDRNVWGSSAGCGQGDLLWSYMTCTSPGVGCRLAQVQKMNQRGQVIYNMNLALPDTGCVACPAGRVADPATNTCVCAPGTFPDAFNRCVSCPTYSTYNASTNQCQCNPGFRAVYGARGMRCLP